MRLNPFVLKNCTIEKTSTEVTIVKGNTMFNNDNYRMVGAEASDSHNLNIGALGPSKSLDSIAVGINESIKKLGPSSKKPVTVTDMLTDSESNLDILEKNLDFLRERLNCALINDTTGSQISLHTIRVSELQVNSSQLQVKVDNLNHRIQSIASKISEITSRVSL